MAVNKALSLAHRESFFDDAFFTDAWADFDLAVQSVLDKFDKTGLQVDTANRNKTTQLYRNIRTTNIDQDLYTSQALQVTEKDGKFQCVMDVKDFSPNDLQVKVVDDRVVVDGKYEKKSEDGTSMTSKSFHREFTLPQQANIELVSTALSKDGVLTIKAPKKEGAITAAPGTDMVSKSASSNIQESSSSSQTVQNDSSSASSVQKKTSFQQSSSVQQSFSSTSSFSSSKKSSVTSSSTMESVDDMSKEMDRLVFSHDNVNLKLKN